MQIERSKLNRWLNNPVTKSYLESLKQLETEVTEELASDKFDSSRVVEAYYRSMGAIQLLRKYSDPVEVILVLHEIKEDEVTE